MEIKEFKLILNDRLFKIGDRIKVFHNHKWYRGTVDHFTPWIWNQPRAIFIALSKISSKYELINEDKMTGKISYYDYTHAHMCMKLDEKIGNDNDLLNGYGLRSTRAGYDIIYEHEDEYDPPKHIFLAEKKEVNLLSSEKLIFT